MVLPEHSRRDNRVSLAEHEQIFIAGDKGVGLGRAQGSQDQLIGGVALTAKSCPLALRKRRGVAFQFRVPVLGLVDAAGLLG
jgi:hypothetical protein